MAINYTTIFTQLGKLVKNINLFMGWQVSSLMADNKCLDEIQDVFTAYADKSMLTGLDVYYGAMTSMMQSWITQHLKYADNLFASLQVELKAPTAGSSVILPLLKIDMIANSQTVLKNVVTVASNPAGTNVGTGVLKVSKTTDSIDDERILAEILKVVCEKDRFSGTAEGEEQFRICGLPKYTSTSYKTRGSGSSGLLIVEAGDIVVNGGFENWSGTVNFTPDDWDVNYGTAGTHIIRNDTVEYLGTYCMSFHGDATQTRICISQSISDLLKANTKYVLGFYIRRNSTLAGAGGNLKVSIEGTSISKAAFNADPITLTTSYVFYFVDYDVDAVFPDDLEIVVDWTSANTAPNGSEIYIDCVVFQPCAIHGNVGYTLFRGSVDFVEGDYFTVTTTNTYAGVFQTFMGRYYNFQLPSDAAPSIADSLAVT